MRRLSGLISAAVNSSGDVSLSQFLFAPEEEIRRLQKWEAHLVWLYEWGRSVVLLLCDASAGLKAVFYTDESNYGIPCYRANIWQYVEAIRRHGQTGTLLDADM